MESKIEKMLLKRGFKEEPCKLSTFKQFALAQQNYFIMCYTDGYNFDFSLDTICELDYDQIIEISHKMQTMTMTLEIIKEI